MFLSESSVFRRDKNDPGFVQLVIDVLQFVENLFTLVSIFAISAWKIRSKTVLERNEFREHNCD